MTDHRAVLSAAFDGECADPAALEDALRHPDAVSTLVEFARLRARLRSDLEPAGNVVPLAWHVRQGAARVQGIRARVWRAAAAAAILATTAGAGYWFGGNSANAGAPMSPGPSRSFNTLSAIAPVLPATPCIDADLARPGTPGIVGHHAPARRVADAAFGEPPTPTRTVYLTSTIVMEPEADRFEER